MTSVLASALASTAAPASAATMAPTIEVTTTPARIVQLVHPDGSKTCLFFEGNEVYMPEGCVLALYGGSGQTDELFEMLPKP